MVKDNIENPCSSYDVSVDKIVENGVYVNDKNVDVYDVNVQPDTKDITITENGTYIPIQYETEYFNEVTVDVQPPLQEKDVQLGINEMAEITPDDGYYGLSKVIAQSPAVPLQNKTLNVTENGSTRLMPDDGYYALHTVDVNVDVNPELESKTIEITENGTTNIIPNENYYGLSNVTVNTNVQPALQEKELSLGINERKEITPDDGYYGLSKVIAQSPAVPLQNKTLNVTENGSTRLMPDEGYYALHVVDVNVDVNPELESKTVDITENGTMNITPDSAYGLSNVTVNTNVQPALQNKTVEYTENGEYNVTNDDGFYGLKQAKINVSIPNTSTAVTITENGILTLTPVEGYYNQVIVNTNVQPPLQEKEIPLGINERAEITPDDGYYGLSKVIAQSPDVPLQNKTVEYTENGEYSVTNDEEFYGLKQVNINVSIPNVSTAVTITENGTMTLTPDNGYYNQVDINTNVQPALQEKELPIGLNERLEITPDENYYGLSKVTVQSPAVPLQNKTLNVTENGNTTLMPDDGYYALHQVEVNVQIPNSSTAVTINQNGTTTLTPTEGYFNEVTVNTNVQPNLQNKDVTITKNGTTTITKDNGYDGLGNVTVTTNVEGGGSIGNYIKIQTPFTGGKIIESTDSILDITKWDLNIQQYNGTFSSLTGFNKIILPIDYFYQENKNDLVSSSIFENCTSLTKIENIDKTRISINSFIGTFNGCSSLTSLDLSYKPEYNYWDMSGVENIERMFKECTSLTTLNIDGWDRAKLSNSKQTFYRCLNLRGIIRLSAHNTISNYQMFAYCRNINEIYYDNDGYDNDAYDNNDLCNMYNFAYNCEKLKKASIKGRRVYQDGYMFPYCYNIEWVDMTGCDYSKYMSGNTSTSNIQPYSNCETIKTLIGDHTLEEVENGDITIYDGLGLSQPRFSSFYFSTLSSLRYSSMLAIAKGLGQHTYSSTQYIRLNQTAWDNMYNDDDTIPDSNTITQRQNTLTDIITSKGWSIQTANS